MAEPATAVGADGPKSLGTVRDHLANERTLLAWSRTSIAIVGLGFVVARFALGGKSVTVLSTAFGVALVILGGVALAAVLELCAIFVCVYLILAA